MSEAFRCNADFKIKKHKPFVHHRFVYFQKQLINANTGCVKFVLRKAALTRLC